jgi:hypothetical protein
MGKQGKGSSGKLKGVAFGRAERAKLKAMAKIGDSESGFCFPLSFQL